jgi:hypothetical protein
MLPVTSTNEAKLNRTRKLPVTKEEAFKFVEAKLHAAHIYVANWKSEGTFPEKSQYFGRYRSDVLQIRVSDHSSEYPRHAGPHIILKDGMSEPELSAIVTKAVAEFGEMEDKFAKEDGII